MQTWYDIKKTIVFVGISLYSICVLSQSNVRVLNGQPALINSIEPTEEKDLSIGDMVPDFEMTMINYPTKKVRLSSFKDKLVILDFWATWCTSCLGQFDKLNAIQKKFGGQVQVVLINANNSGDDSIKVENFLRDWKSRQADFQLPIAILDSVAIKLFPHVFVPHYVWILPDGSLRALTSSNEVSENNIASVISKEEINIPLKKDIYLEHPLYLSNETNIDELTQYSILVKGYITGLPRGSRLRKSGETDRGISIMNSSILNLYKIAILKARNFNVSDKLIIIKTSDTSKYYYANEELQKFFTNRANLYTYDFIVPASEANNLYKYMWDDINRYSGYVGTIQKRNTACLLLQVKKGTNGINSRSSKAISNDKNSQGFRYSSLSMFIDQLNESSITSLPIINASHYPDRTMFEIPEHIEDLAALKKFLDKNNLELVESRQIIDMLVLTRKDSN